MPLTAQGIEFERQRAERIAGKSRNGHTRREPIPDPRQDDSPAAEVRSAPDDWPADMGPAAFHGLAGDVVRVTAPHTEADPHAILMDFLVLFANAAGDDAHIFVGADRHVARLFAVIVGTTSKGRKGQSYGLARWPLALAEPGWADNITTGLSSGEGLIYAVRDPITRQEAVKEKGRVVDYQEIEVDPGVSDKRLAVVEPEFARTIRVAGRDGSITSPVIRDSWDTGTLRVMTKNAPIKATGAHIGILGQITRDELLRELSTSDIANGLGNRFLFQMARRSKLLPDGGQPPVGEIEELGARLAEALRFAAAAGRMGRDSAATDLWHTKYPELSAERPGLFGAMTARAEAQVLRLSMVYALLDLNKTIREQHLEAALAVWERAEATVKFLFGDLTGDSLADTILRALRAQGELSQTDVNALFGRHVPAERIGKATTLLMEAGLTVCERIETSGRTLTVWKAK
jgi:hypothetical protein